MAYALCGSSSLVTTATVVVVVFAGAVAVFDKV
jgi:hypothetical protein